MNSLDSQTHERNPRNLLKSDQNKSYSEKTSKCMQNLSTEIEELNDTERSNQNEVMKRNLDKMDVLRIKVYQIEHQIHLQSVQRIREDLRRIKIAGKISTQTQLSLRVVILNTISESYPKVRPLLIEAIKQYQQAQYNIFFYKLRQQIPH